jgi:hypothetical protein
MKTMKPLQGFWFFSPESQGSSFLATAGLKDSNPDVIGKNEKSAQ